MNKLKQFDALINEISMCDKCLNITKKNNIDCSLVNIFKDNDFCRNIPSIWTDWYNRLDSNIFIIGQDWDPVNDMKKYYLKYKKLINDNKKEASIIWKDIIEEEKSMTKKMLYKYLIESASINNKIIDSNYINKIYITNAIMCGRKGNNYRDTKNFKVKECTINCSSFLKRQIEIVRPKVILTLGYYPLFALSKIYNFNIEKTLSNTIEKQSVIKINNIIIIPLYHPSAQINCNKQIEQYKRIWEYIDL